MVETETIHGDALDVLDDLEEESFHAVVTDPPYGLAFMGRDWDDFEPKEYQEWCKSWATKAKRVLKPGGHLLAFSGNRTHHRLFTGVEDAGFEIRDTLTWHYGSGFPKASDISKTIDKREGAEREVVGENPNNRDRSKHDYHSVGNVGSDAKITEPATDAAKKWDGWKTGLKPATEYVVMARKPFDGATVDSVLEHGTGALNIDATRIGRSEDVNVPGGERTKEVDRKAYGEFDSDTEGREKDYAGDWEPGDGRFPAYVIFDENSENLLDSDKSRFFYTTKAKKDERTMGGRIENDHPTVKPIDLMEWLVKLVTAEGQRVLDPFAGTGTTLMAAYNLGRSSVGIEKDDEHVEVAKERVRLNEDHPDEFGETPNHLHTSASEVDW